MRTEGEDVLLGLKIYRIFLMDAVLLAEKKFIFLLLIWLLGNWVFSTLKCTLHLTFEGSLCQVTQAATELESQAGARSHLVQCFQFTKVGVSREEKRGGRGHTVIRAGIWGDSGVPCLPQTSSEAAGWGETQASGAHPPRVPITQSQRPTVKRFLALLHLMS